MSISNLSAWNGVTPAANVIEDANPTNPSPLSPAIAGIELSGAFTQDNKYYVGFKIQIAAGYWATAQSVTTTDTITVTVETSEHNTIQYINHKVETSADYQNSDFTLNFDIAVSGQTLKTYKFTKKAKIKIEKPKHK